MLKDLNYFPLDVESNIYGMASLQFEDRTNKVLVATSDCRIYCINYNRYKPQTKEVEFTYIPAGAKILSIGCLKRGPNDFVIGITHSLAAKVTTKGTSAREFLTDSYSGRTTTFYFNIYANESVPPSFDLDQVAQSCQTLRLKYVPYHLYSTEIIKLTSSIGSPNKQVSKVPFWLLSGGDNNLHAFFEDRISQSFNEIPIEECLPELVQKRGLVLWIDIANLGDYSNFECRRLVALGYEDGSVRLLQSVMDGTTGTYKLVKESCFDEFTTIIPCVKMFKINGIGKGDSRLRRKVAHDIHREGNSDLTIEKLNLLVVSSTNNALVFRDVLKNGLTDSQDLPDSQRLDCSTTASIGDTNIDGLNELLIGTHGKEILTYQYDSTDDKYKLEHVNISNYPVFALSLLDLTDDGLKDVIILLTNGLLVMQSSTIVDAIEICKRRIRTLLRAIE